MSFYFIIKIYKIFILYITIQRKYKYIFYERIQFNGPKCIIRVIRNI